jgi:hypothetical protein
MGDAYTPGLTVTRHTVVRKTRRLPLPGEVLKQVGDRVTSADVVARTQLPGKVHLLNLATVLGVMPDELPGTLVDKVGGPVVKGEPVALTRSFFGLFTLDPYGVTVYGYFAFERIADDVPKEYRPAPETLQHRATHN